MRSVSLVLRRALSPLALGGLAVGGEDISADRSHPRTSTVTASAQPRRAPGGGEYHGVMALAPSRRNLAASALLALGLAGCGSSTKTVTIESPKPVATLSTTTPTTTTSTSTTPATSPSAQTTTPTGGSSAQTRSAPEPSFTETESHAEGASAAAAIVRANGYTPNNVAEYHPDQTLRVLVGTRTGSGDGYGQRAFFFLDGSYLGTDTKEPSAHSKVVSRSDTEVAIAYPLYRSSDPLCCASGGQRIVHFALNNGKLTALDPIPPASSKTGLSRY